MKRVYVAGRYSDKDFLRVFANIGRGIRFSVQVLLAGYAPFCPWLDCLFFLLLGEDEYVTVETMYKHSMAWLEVSDAVLVTPGWEKSKGTVNEIARAKELGIPVFFELENLRKYFTLRVIN